MAGSFQISAVEFGPVLRSRNMISTFTAHSRAATVPVDELNAISSHLSRFALCAKWMYLLVILGLRAPVRAISAIDAVVNGHRTEIAACRHCGGEVQSTGSRQGASLTMRDYNP